MKIGIIGSEGVVGNACKFGFRKLGHEVKCHDVVLNTELKDLVECEVIFICVPTPSNADGSCDTSIVESVIGEVHKTVRKTRIETGKGLLLKYPIIAIKSTIQPGTVHKLQKKYTDMDPDQSMKICFVPEFLRERCAITDFTENHDLCVIGTNDERVFAKIKEIHGNLPEKIIQLTPEEAEFVKYFNNAYNATLVTFANSFYEICRMNGVNYTNVKNAVVNRKHIMHHYLECNENFRGFGGMCLPKDLRALNKLAENTRVKFFQNILDENEKYKTTVFEGMRDE